MNEIFNTTNNRFIKVRKKQKTPLESNWQSYNNYSWNDKKIQDWISEGGNVGLATGYNGILVVDFDDKDFEKEMLPKLPKTLIQESGSKGKHLFYKLKEGSSDSFKILDSDKNTLADIQCKGKQIIVAPSIHPNGNKYKFLNDEPIAEINYSEIKAIFSEYMKKDQQNIKKYNGDLTSKKPSLSKVLSDAGVNTTMNPTSCPWHHSNGGKCFSFNESKGVWNCFHCGTSGDVIRFVEENDNCNFKEACEKLNIKLTNNKSKEIISSSAEVRVELTPYLRNNPDELGHIVGDELCKLPNLFYRPYFNQIVEVVFIRSEEDIEKNRTRMRIGLVDADRLTNLILKNIGFYTKKKVKDDWEEVPANLTKQFVSLFLKNDVFLSKLRPLDKVMSAPYIYDSQDGLNIEFKGYSSKTNILYSPNTPPIVDVKTKDAIETINKILDGFCFEDNSDKEIAISFLLTPLLRGLYNDKRERTPCFALIANRERAGKDYLAGIRTILYTGSCIDHPPIADGERANVEEWRKKFSSMLMNGETIFHSANNVGYLNNPVFEALITSKTMQDRILGTNTQKSFDNCLDISFSANIGLRWRGDMSGRLRRINLFYGEEDPNSRRFPIVDLHGYVEKNRGLILSCLVQLIKDWYDAGKPNQDDKIFSSFPTWARFCGSIMDYHNLGNPLIHQQDDELGGNDEERKMCAVYDLMFRWQGNTNKETVQSKDIISAIEEFQQLDDKERSLRGFDSLDEETLTNIPLANQGDRLRLGHLITKFKGRTLNKIKFSIVQQNKEAKRRLYKFHNAK
jgi:hypothetical protein